MLGSGHGAKRGPSADPEVGSEGGVGHRADAILPIPFVFKCECDKPDRSILVGFRSPIRPNSLTQPTAISNSR